MSEHMDPVDRRGLLALGAAASAAVMAPDAHAQAVPPIDDRYVLRSRAPVNVRDHGATGDGSTDDTAAFQAAMAAAAPGNRYADSAYGGTVYVPPGTYVIGDVVIPGRYLTLVGAGYSSVLRVRSGASYGLRLEGVQRVKVESLRIDAVDRVRSCVLMQATPEHASEQHVFERVNFTNGAIGLHIAPGTPGWEQADKNVYLGCWWSACTTAVKIDSVNAQEQTFIGCDIWNGLPYASAVGIDLANGSLSMLGCQFQTAGSTGIRLSGNTIEFVTLTDVIFEGQSVDIDGSVRWAVNHVTARNVVFQGTSRAVRMGTGSAIFTAEHCRFNQGGIEATAADQTFYDLFCTYNAGAAWTPTGAQPRHIRWDRNGLELDRGEIRAQALNSGRTPLVAKALSGQTGDLLQIQDDLGTPFSRITSAGAVWGWPRSGNDAFVAHDSDGRPISRMTAFGLQFDATHAHTSVPPNTLFRDAADGRLKFKDDAGVVRALY